MPQSETIPKDPQAHDRELLMIENYSRSYFHLRPTEKVFTSQGWQALDPKYYRETPQAISRRECRSAPQGARHLPRAIVELVSIVRPRIFTRRHGGRKDLGRRPDNVDFDLQRARQERQGDPEPAQSTVAEKRGQGQRGQICDDEL